MASLAELIAKQPGKLSVVGTPIGNLDDASPRVLNTLRDADVVLCEDTRVTSKLLTAFKIHTSLERCDENIIKSKCDSVLERLEMGLDFAFVSDAGMPGVSDPGQVLVDAALNAGYKVEVIPGPSAVTCALAASGFNMEHFFFEGFLPRKKNAQKQRLAFLAGVPGALVVYESPYRVKETLANITEVFPNRNVALVRELTKIYEECVRGTSGEVADIIANREQVKGECVIVISTPTSDELEQISKAVSDDVEPETIEDAIKQGLEQGRPKSALARQLSRKFDMDRSEVYDLVNEIARA